MHRLLENYIATTEELLDSFPKKRRAEELTELKQHLESLMEDYKKNGLSDDVAAQQAVEQCGHPMDVCSGLLKARTRQTMGSVQVWRAFFLIFLLSWCSSLITVMVLKYAFGPSVLNANTFASVVILVFNTLVTFGIGMVSGLLFPRGAVKASVLLVSATLIFNLAIFGLEHGEIVHDISMTSNVFNSLGSYFIQLIVLIFGAMAGRQLRMARSGTHAQA